jgi:hypothetical protein
MWIAGAIGLFGVPIFAGGAFLLLRFPGPGEIKRATLPPGDTVLQAGEGQESEPAGPVAARFEQPGRNNLMRQPDVPAAHPRLIFADPAKLRTARAWRRAHRTWKPTSALDHALDYITTGNEASAQRAIADLMKWVALSGPGSTIQKQLQPPPRATASDLYRITDWVLLVFDWCFNAMREDQRNQFIALYNTLADLAAKQPYCRNVWDNYYWGYLRNGLEWAICTWTEQPAKAQGYWADWHDGQWARFVKRAAGWQGVMPEGNQYGQVCYSYPIRLFLTCPQFGVDFMADTPFFKTAVPFLAAYLMTRQKTHVKDEKFTFFQDMPWSDAESCGGYPESGAGPFHSRLYKGDFMTAATMLFGSASEGGFARQFLNVVKPPVSTYLQAIDPGTPAPIDWTTVLPDTFADTAGSGLVISHGPASTFYGQTFVLGLHCPHNHVDWGSFQLWRNGYWLSKEFTEYALPFGTGNNTSCPCNEGPAHNGLRFGGKGPAHALWKKPARLLHSGNTADWWYDAMDLSGTYRTTQRAPYDNPHCVSHVRERLWLKGLEVLVVLDRCQADAATRVRDFCLHTPLKPTLTARGLVATNGTEALSTHILLPANPTLATHDESVFKGTHDKPSSWYGWFTTISDSGQTKSYFLTVHQCRAASDPDLRATLTDNGTSWTVTLVLHNGRQATIQLPKGMAPAGGSVNGVPLPRHGGEKGPD